MGFNGGASLKRIRQIRGYGAFIVAGVLVATLYLSPLGGIDAIVGTVVFLILAFGGLQLHLASRTPETAIVLPPINPNDLPLPERARYFRRLLIMSATLIPALSLWFVYDLNQLESGAVAEISLPSPIAFLYENLGYWPAVLAMPALGVFLICVALVKLTNLPDR